ncbi:hypothetical protein DPMN_152823 [Dreissena polymorpha]|uniref:Uncharacterized protein n=1 Tax=Dreissena polymorpha TaxID=45954 RepID=A0A9D4FNQ6_DREPO|nr:hypothetical protein DPMN_152823 [Dreissena polymorpha]
MRLRITQARPVSLNDVTRDAVEFEAFNRAGRAKSDGNVSAVATDGSKPTKSMSFKRWLICSKDGLGSA